MTWSALRRVRLNWYDAIGAALVTAYAAWIVLSAAVRAGNPIPQVALVIGATIAYVIGRKLGREPAGVVRVAASAVVAIVIAVALSGPAAFAGGPLAPPLGYGNANGTLYVLGTGAAVIVALAAKPDTVRAAAGMFAVVFAVFAAATLSRAATILAAGVLLVALFVRRLPRWTLFAGPVVVATSIAVTITLAFTAGRSLLPSLVEQLSERRPQLWREAVQITHDEPLFGVGPGMFAQTSPTAIADSDARWTHSAFLQVAAELGVVGAALLVLLLLWAYGALHRSGHDSRLVLAGAAILTAFAVHATIDYVAHIPIVTLITALLTGSLGGGRYEKL